MVGQLRNGLETSGILKMDGLTIMDSGGFISARMKKKVFGYGEKSMAGSGVTNQPGHSSGVTPVATGPTCSFVKNRTRSFLIIPQGSIQTETSKYFLVQPIL